MIYSINNERYDLYSILCDSFCINKPIHGTEPTNSLLLIGEPDKDLRCVIFSYSWDHSKELRNVQFDYWDGREEITDDYRVKTVYQKDMERALRESDEIKVLIGNKKISSIKFIGQGETVQAVIDTY